ncbi:carboxylesterase/lipase family protein [Streptomyces sp. NBC_00986]|uniref:carboxylesterase/lipase family protein n=1 Tax=Streptomyces sp. NBC_00986 TaxID=2903702 RepID=UPI00386F8B34|nr:carboxylesterase family protein [Streptomyces sp. NBC_00986]
MSEPLNRQPVPTESGLVAGTPAKLPGVTVFKGIPYAAAPSGPLRWRPPQPPAPWTGVRNAADFGPVCPQTPRGQKLRMSEDCLSLNVWTAAEPSDRTPVLVWIHGGRFIMGAGSEPLYDGAALAGAGLVVVTLNYRLGVLGFLATPELSAESEHGSSGNYGLLDQIAALRWVRDNIAAFGGDPDRVTIAGQSAGGACVQDLMYSPPARGLFHGAIAESGARHPRDPSLAYLASSYRTREQAEAEGTRHLQDLGVATLEELRALPLPDLLRGNDADQAGGGHQPPLFRPVRDGWVFPHSYAEALALGTQADIPVITGTNKDEDGASPKPHVSLAEYTASARRHLRDSADDYLALYPASTDAEAGRQSSAAARDHARTSTWLWATEWAKHARSPVYTYYWTHVPPGPDAESAGAYHGSEINYFLNNLYATDRPWTAEDHRIADTVSRYVVNFAATGDPNGPALRQWVPADPAAPATMEIGDRFGPIPAAEPPRLDLHRRLMADQRAW